MIINSEHKLEVQGLGAIAVLAYVFYNSQIILFDEQLFKGGFIGIDILFVLILVIQKLYHHYIEDLISNIK